MGISVSKRGHEPQEELARGRSDDVAKIIRDRLERDPFGGGGSREIRLKDANLVCRWFNGAKSSDRIWQAKHRMGWRDVTPDMVMDLEQLGGHDVVNGVVSRGERGQERLLCMPKDAFRSIQAAKTEANDRGMGSSKRTKRDIAERAAAELGPQAAEWVESNVIGEVRDHVETVHQSPAEDE